MAYQSGGDNTACEWPLCLICLASHAKKAAIVNNTSLVENTFVFLGSQASGHQALSAFLREQSQAKSGTFRDMVCHDFT